MIPVEVAGESPVAPSGRPLRILLLEDEARDAELMQFELQTIGVPFTTKVVATEAAFRAALRDFAPDLILADFSLPSFDGLTALAIARELRREAPFIFVSGSIGEEKVAALLRNGATDLVLKRNLLRLGPTVTRALRELEQRAEARRAVQALREAIDVLRDTKRSFKSRALGDLRQKLERLVETTPWF
jgi:CheY-like chemotaxis protein